MNKPVLTLEDAKRVASAAAAEARANEWKVSIVIVDDGGHLLYLEREHDTRFGSVETATAKAHMAAALHMATKVSEDAVMNGRLIHLALPGVIPAEGGVPLMRNGIVIGAIGISGVRSVQDGQIAAVGANAL
ncbi:MAG: heme-binding protein [Gallionellaceae bacterium]